MSNKRLFFFAPILFLTAFLSHAQQMGLYPLSQYSVGTNNNGLYELRTTTAVQNDTLKIPYIEDFSGPGLPIDSMSVDTFSTSPTVLIYRITHLKMHGLKSGDSIRIYIASSDNTLINQVTLGIKYVKVLDKYAFQLFNDPALTIPLQVLPTRLHYINWLYLGRGGYSSVPDTLGFSDNNGGVFINTDMALNPISIGVASFDGVNYKGIPYSTGTTKGYADNLTSLPFNLSTYLPSDSIYMSFYWQSKSLGDSPLSSEFLALEFYDTSGTWKQVWQEYGNQVTEDTFLVAMVPITDSLYLHKGFQYRFRSFGVLYGRFNVWNLDYIYIDTNRRINNPYLKDVSIITTNRSALKNYTSVPYKHIKDLPVSTITSETADASMKIRNNYTQYIVGPPIAIERKHKIRENITDVIIKFQNEPGLDIQSDIFNQPFIDTIPGANMTAPYVLKEEFYYQPVDTIGPIDMTFNNFTAIETYFYDWYSYDDGTPEISILNVNQGGNKLANEFKIFKDDQLTHVDFCFLKNYGTDLTNSTLILTVWDKLLSPANPIYSQQISIRYNTSINGFVRYELTTPLPLSANSTYYIGFSQLFNNPLFLGFDKNNDHLDKIYYCNDGNTWLPYKGNITDVPGSLMIRPVFSHNEIITGTTDNQTLFDQFSLYPNPAKSELHFTGEPEYISIYDLSGLLLVEKKVEGTEVISTESLTSGLYLITLSKGDYKEVKRLIIQK